MFSAMVGILNGSLAIWIFFVLVYSILCVYISFKIYFVSYVLDGFIQFKNSLTERGFRRETFVPIRKG